MPLHSSDTWLFEIPLIPIACTRSSTLRVETPWIHASWITATKACSVVRRGSRKPGTYEPLRSLGILRSSVPRRVSKARWRYPPDQVRGKLLRCVVRSSLRSYRPAPICPSTS